MSRYSANETSKCFPQRQQYFIYSYSTIFQSVIYDPNKLCNVHDVSHAATTNRIINPVYIDGKFDQPSTNILYPTKILKNRS